jgi:hypothetical protein
MRFLMSLFAANASNESFSRRLDRLNRRQPSPVTGRVVFRTRTARQEA